MSEILLSHVTKKYGPSVVALEDFSLQIQHGECVVVLGPSGCGKSTLLRIIAGLEEPTSGEVFLNGALASSLLPSERELAMVFQNEAVYPHLSVGENLVLGSRSHILRGRSWWQLGRGALFSLLSWKGGKAGSRAKGQQDLSEHFEDIVEFLELGCLLEKMPGQLSGGERRRVALGRALLKGGKILLLDEPLSGLDTNLRSGLRRLLGDLPRQFGHGKKITTLYVTHDQREAFSLANRVVVMNQGQIEQIGRPEEIYQSPANLFVANFVGDYGISTILGRAGVDGECFWFLPEGLSKEGRRLEWPLKNISAKIRQRLQGVSGKVLLGGRPEDFPLLPENEECITATMEGEVLRSECTGPSYCFQVSLLGGKARVWGGLGTSKKLVGEKIRLAIDLETILFFDQESGENRSF